jgi:hypothetical protein
MITTVIDLIIALLDLVRTQARALRRMVVDLGWGLAFIMIAAILVLASAVFFLLGTYQYFSSLISPVAAAFLVSLVALLLAVIAAWIAHRKVH